MMIVATVAERSIRAATAATISFTPTDADGEPLTDDLVDITVGVTRSDGTDVVASGTAADMSGASASVDLTAAQTATVDILTVTWSDTGGVIGSTVVDVIGSHLLSYADMVRYEAQAAPAKDRFVEMRRYVDDEFHRITSRGLTPRFVVETIPAESRRVRSLRLACPDLRSVRWARKVNTDGTTTAIDVSGVQPDASGIAWLPSSCWPCERIEIGYEYGYSAAPEDVKRAAARCLRVSNTSGGNQFDPRGQTFTNDAGYTINFGDDPEAPTGIVDVDKVLRRHRWSVAVA